MSASQGIQQNRSWREEGASQNSRLPDFSSAVPACVLLPHASFVVAASEVAVPLTVAAPQASCEAVPLVPHASCDGDVVFLSQASLLSVLAQASVAELSVLTQASVVGVSDFPQTSAVGVSDLAQASCVGVSDLLQASCVGVDEVLLLAHTSWVAGGEVVAGHPAAVVVVVVVVAHASWEVVVVSLAQANWLPTNIGTRTARLHSTQRPQGHGPKPAAQHGRWGGSTSKSGYKGVEYLLYKPSRWLPQVILGTQ